jgi:hypothetical protein
MTRLTRLLACWGNGQFGRLGHNSQSSELFPRIIPNLLGVTSASAGGAHTAAVTGLLTLESVDRDATEQTVASLAGVFADHKPATVAAYRGRGSVDLWN